MIYEDKVQRMIYVQKMMYNKVQCTRNKLHY